jgi:DNA-binding MarR family transcriptional regulator
MSLDNLTEQQALVPIMSKLIKELNAIMAREFQSHNVQLTKEQAIILKKLAEQDGCPQTDLALVTSRDKTSLTRLLSTMEAKKLIRRKTSKVDKRINLVFITKKGQEEIEKATPIVLNILNQAVYRIDEKRIESTKALLNDIYQNLNIHYEE